ncbi:MAG: replicative DNA helicase [Deltaproteobacteria bacterium]|nr:replicative DNA helicase [Deltaproteobacteria bacterium]
MTDKGREPEGRIPFDLEAEKSLLSAIFQDALLFDRAGSRLGPDDFFSTAHREIFDAMRRLSSGNREISLMSVVDELKRADKLDAVGGVGVVGDMVGYVGTTASFDFLLGSVKNRAIQRKLVEGFQGIVREGMSDRADIDELLHNAERKVFELVQQRPVEAAHPLEEILSEVHTDILRRLETGEAVLGIQSGFSDLDEMTSGFQKGNLIIIAARPSMGKTALALNIGQHAATRLGKKVVIFSLEMSRHELALRLLATESGVDSKRLREGRLTQRETEAFFDAYARLSRTPMVVDDSAAISIFDIRTRARRLRREDKCDLIILDYLQLAKGSTGGRDDKSRQEEIAEVSRMLKAIAKELEVPVIALSQLNRSLEARKDKRPLLSDLRESGSIEQDADVILFIYRDEYYEKNSKDKGIAELLIGKQRNGPTGVVKVGFQPNLTRFVPLQRSDLDLSPGFDA